MKTMNLFLTGIVFLIMCFATSVFASGGAGGQAFTQQYTYDFAVQGGAVGFKSLITPANPLPLGAIVTAVHYRMVTAFTSGGSATVSIGDAASNARYLALTAFDNAAYAIDNVAAAAIGVPNLIATTEGNVGITIAVAALTAGKMIIVVSGYIPKS